MSGHSKWATTKRRKEAVDAVRGKVFARYARLIMLESKKASGDTSAPNLAAVIARAKADNVPKDNIDRAVAKGASKEGASLEEITYEAYGPAGVAIIATALTDNKNRTTPEIKHLLSKLGFEVSAPGAASWAFAKTGMHYIPNEPLVDISGDDEEKLVAILEALDDHEDVQAIFTNARGYENTDEDES